VRSGRFGWDLDRNSLDHAQAGALESGEFVRVVRDDLDLAESEVEKDLGALLVFPGVNDKAKPLVGLDRIGTLVLQGVGANLVEDADAAAFLLVFDC